MSCYEFIARGKAADPGFSIELACATLGVSRSGYYDWKRRKKRPLTARQRENQRLMAEITMIHLASSKRYGAPRIYAELRARGWVVGENRVARIMAENGIYGRCGRRRRHHLTRQAKVQPQIPDLLKRRFHADEPDSIWCSDISYVPTDEGWLYTAVILDVCSRAVVGWAADEHMRTELVLDAWTMAVHSRRPGAGLIVHSDRGSQYTSQAWLDALDSHDARASMGRVGQCWDNAMAESWFAGFKNELVHPAGPFATKEEARREIARYIRWHNLERRHSALGQVCPAEFEQTARLSLAA